jgi:hypothetical protein
LECIENPSCDTFGGIIDDATRKSIGAVYKVEEEHSHLAWCDFGSAKGKQLLEGVIEAKERII